MTRSFKTKDRLLRAMSAFVLDNGLTEATLRPLANAADTSDRMLIYHFGSKEQIVCCILERIAEEFMDKLECALPRRSFETRRALLNSVLATVRSPVLAAYVRVWREITATAALGSLLHSRIGHDITMQMVDFLAARMPEHDRAALQSAQMMATLIEGVHVMDSVGHSPMAMAAIDAMFPQETRKPEFTLIHAQDYRLDTAV